MKPSQQELKDPEGFFDSENEEIQMILIQGYDVQGAGAGNSCETRSGKDFYRPSINLASEFETPDTKDRSQDSESIEEVWGPEELEDEVFLGYFTVDSDGKKRPIPAPRRLVQMPTTEELVLQVWRQP